MQSEEENMSGYNDPNHPGNGEKYHTGKKCIERDCNELAGTAWSSYWCFRHNVERIDRISQQLEGLIKRR